MHTFCPVVLPAMPQRPGRVSFLAAGPATPLASPRHIPSATERLIFGRNRATSTPVTTPKSYQPGGTPFKVTDL